ncbi:hypothetical protein [Micromonospora carbonacea]|uniref:Uncharacterized protein n=1 Tax=Micromonospora carbonacea TaxID=47853 RepID=A0A1C4WAZ9_9ACTN|nr:hypothetical protein [Micromonospora carbonacea]SCE93372.1 hypothetical protein GA0070563_103249 [Micromonospora carbonacea]
MSAEHPRRGRPVPTDASSPAPAVTVTVTLVCVTALLMVFSLVSWVLDNGTLAAVSGTAACTLALDIGRRLLGIGTRDSGPAAGRGGRDLGDEAGQSPLEGR